MAVGKDEIIHDDVDERSVEEAGADGVLGEKWHNAGGKYEACCPD